MFAGCVGTDVVFAGVTGCTDDFELLDERLLPPLLPPPKTGSPELELALAGGALPLATPLTEPGAGSLDLFAETAALGGCWTVKTSGAPAGRPASVPMAGAASATSRWPGSPR